MKCCAEIMFKKDEIPMRINEDEYAGPGGDEGRRRSTEKRQGEIQAKRFFSQL
jgi:hypothetical protein